MRTIITGPGRCGTVWLSRMIAENCECESFHEPFHLGNFATGFASWMGRGDDAVMVSHYARSFIPEIQSVAHARWGFLWRDPVDLIRSWVVRDVAYLQFNDATPIGVRMRTLARQYLGDLEACLGLFEGYGISVEHFHFDRFTTKEGFAALAGALGLPRQPHETTLVERVNETAPEAKLPVSAIDGATVDYVRTILLNLPRSRAAYEGAKGGPV